MNVIPNLRVGGAEKFCLRLSEDLSELGVIGSICTFVRGGADALRANDNFFIFDLLCVERFRKLIGADAIFFWMSASFVLSLFFFPFNRKVIWMVRREGTSLDGQSVQSYMLSRVAVVLSYVVPQRIVYCSEGARRSHERIGYNPRVSVVIPNYVGCAAVKLRRELCVEAIYVGRVAAAKNLPLLFNVIARTDYVVHCYGEGMEDTNPVIQTLRTEFPGANLRMFGVVNDLSSRYCSYDFLISTSDTEGFPNAISEAVSSGLPVICTDAGASREIVQGFGHVTAPRVPLDLVRAIELFKSEDHCPKDMHLSATSRYSKAAILNNYKQLIIGGYHR